MGIEDKKDNIEEIIEETEKSLYSTCKQCGYFGGGHLENCLSLKEKEKIQCPLCEALNGHSGFCENNPINKQEKEQKEKEKRKIEEKEEFSFSKESMKEVKEKLSLKK